MEHPRWAPDHKMSLCPEEKKGGSGACEFMGNELLPAQVPRNLDLYKVKLPLRLAFNG